MANLRNLDISVYVEAVVLARKDDGTIIHESDVEALGVLDLRLQGGDDVPILSKDGQVEVVVVVGDRNVSICVDADADRVVGDA